MNVYRWPEIGYVVAGKHFDLIYYKDITINNSIWKYVYLQEQLIVCPFNKMGKTYWITCLLKKLTSQLSILRNV